MSYEKLFLLTGAILTFFPAPLRAQAPEFVNAKIVTLSWQDNIKNLWYQSKDGPRNMEAYSRGLTTPIDYTGPAIIHFHPDAETLALPYEERPAPLATAKLPQSGGEFLFIFTATKKETPRWDIRVIDNSAERFPAGAYRFLNLTTSPLRIALDQTLGSVPASSVSIIRPTNGEPTRDLNVQFALGNRIIYSSIWGHEEKRKANVFIVPDPYVRNGISVKQFYQAVVEVEVAPQN